MINNKNFANNKKIVQLFQWTALCPALDVPTGKKFGCKSWFSIETNLDFQLNPISLLSCGRRSWGAITNSSGPKSTGGWLLVRGKEGGVDESLNKACQEKSSVWRKHICQLAQAGAWGVGLGAVGRLNRACLCFLLALRPEFFHWKFINLKKWRVEIVKENQSWSLIGRVWASC